MSRVFMSFTANFHVVNPFYTFIFYLGNCSFHNEKLMIGGLRNNWIA